MCLHSNRRGSQTSIEASSASVYYSGVYWNNFVPVREYLNRLATGNETVTWQDHLFQYAHAKPFRKALILSCGNGWLESELYVKGIIESAVGVDINDQLLNEARAKAISKGLPVKYYKIDSNKVDIFPESGYDIVFNHASLHHVAHIDRNVRAVYELLRKTDGIFVNYEFIGPHRNQYDAREWDVILDMNRKTEASLRRTNLVYPHLQKMLKVDPSEAVHSELIVTTVNRYFLPLWNRSLNGPLAYELLTHNKKLEKFQHIDNWAVNAPLSVQKHFKRILRADEEHAKNYEGSSLFWYSISKPQAEPLPDYLLNRWQKEEISRESRAKANGGRYYPPTSVAKRTCWRNPLVPRVRCKKK